MQTDMGRLGKLLLLQIYSKQVGIAHPMQGFVSS